MKALLLSLLLTNIPALPPRVYPIHITECARGNACSAIVFLGMGIAMQKVNFRLCDVRAFKHDKKTGILAGRAVEELHDLIRKGVVMYAIVPQKPNCFGAGCDLKDDFGQTMAYIMVNGKMLGKHLTQKGYLAPRPKMCEYMQTSLKL